MSNIASISEDEDESSLESNHHLTNHVFTNQHLSRRNLCSPSLPQLHGMGRRLSWTSVSTSNLSEPLYLIAKEDKALAEKFRVLLKPPEFDRDDLLCSVHNFISTLADYVPSIRNDKSFVTFKTIRSFLSANESTRLYGLLIHFSYWNVIHPVARMTVRTMQDHNDLRLFEQIDVNRYHPEKRLKMPSALLEIEAKTRQKPPKNYSEIDAMFQSQYHDLEQDADIPPTPLPTKTDAAETPFSANFSVNSYDTDASLTALEKEQLFVQLESCIVALFKKVFVINISIFIFPS
jgi:hypothetical protein